MGWFTGIVVYAIIWWVVLFTVLPWGNRPAEDPEPGHAESAPVNPRIGLKILITTLIAAVLWVAAYFLIESDLMSFRPGGS